MLQNIYNTSYIYRLLFIISFPLHIASPFSASKSRLMNDSIHHPAHKANYQIDFLYSYPLIKSPYHPSNPINHPKHPAGKYPIQNHRSRNRKNLTSNPKHLSFQMSQYRDKKFYRKAIMLQIYFNYILYFLDFATIISYFYLI